MKRIFIFYYANPDDLNGNMDRYMRLKQGALKAGQSKKCEIKVVAAQLALSVDIDSNDVVMFVCDNAKQAESFLKSCIAELIKKIPSNLVGLFCDNAIDISNDDCLQLTSFDPISMCSAAITNLNVNIK